MKNNIFVSIVIPTLNRPRILINTVGYLLKQTYRNYEIIIVDQSDSCNAGKTKNELKDVNKIKYLHIEEKGLPNARNVGIKESEADIIVFLDDDVISDNNLILYHVQGYNNSQVGCVGGRVIDETNDIKNTDTIGGKVCLSGWMLVNWDIESNHYIYSACGCNMSFSREAIKRTGFFDVRFEGSSQFEETDYCYRLRKLGYKILFEPRASVRHLRVPTDGCRMKEPFQAEYYRFHNTILFYCKNMNTIFLPYVILIHFLVAIKKVLIPSSSIKEFIKVLKGMVDGYNSYRYGNCKADKKILR